MLCCEECRKAKLEPEKHTEQYDVMEVNWCAIGHDGLVYHPLFLSVCVVSSMAPAAIVALFVLGAGPLVVLFNNVSFRGSLFVLP